MPTKQSSRRIDWSNIKVTVVSEGDPNPGNPYSALPPEARLEQLQALYQQIYLRIIERNIEST